MGCGVEECLDEVGAFGLCEELSVVGVGVEVVEEAVELGEGGDGAVEHDCVRRLAGRGLGDDIRAACSASLNISSLLCFKSS